MQRVLNVVCTALIQDVSLAAVAKLAIWVFSRDDVVLRGAIACSFAGPSLKAVNAEEGWNQGRASFDALF